MRLPSPIPGHRGSGQATPSRTPAPIGPRAGSARGPALALHLSGGTLAWALVDAAAGPLLLDAGTLELSEGAAAGPALAALIAGRDLPRSAARIAVPGALHLITAAEAAAAPPAAPLDGITDVALADGRVLRAALDRGALATALEACAAAGLEVVGAEPEALALARALAAPAAPGAPAVPTAVVWRAARAVTALCVRGDAVEPLGSAPLPAGSSAAVAAAVAAKLLAGCGAGAIALASATGDDAQLAGELAARCGVSASAPDPLARIRRADAAPDSVTAAAGAVGLAIEVRGLPRVDLPVRTPRAQERPALHPLAGLVEEPAVAAAPAAAGPAPVRPARRRAPSNRVVATLVAALAVSAALVAVWTLAQRGEVRDRVAVRDTLQARLDAIPAPNAPTRRLLVLGADRRGRVDAIASVLTARPAWERILREVSAVLPADAWLTGLETSTPAGAAAPRLRLSGYAASQEAVARALARLGIVPDLRDVRLVRSERARIQGRAVVRFSLSAGLRTGAA